MKKFIIASLAAAVGGMVFSPSSAKAGGDEVAAAIGGFIGGVIVGSAVHDHDHDRRHDDRRHAHYDRGCPPPRGGHVIIDTRHRPRGHWDWVTVRVWVPGRYTVSFDHCGRRYRTWVPGHHEVRRERVWVDSDRRRGHRYERYAYDSR